MKVLIVGGGKGSWEMRGLQLGAALGARVLTDPSDADFAWCDVAVLVKKQGTKFARQAQRSGKPIVWDALDFWSQPAENRMPEARAKDLLQAQIRAIKPSLVIGATEAMAAAARAYVPAEYLPHHSWAGLVPKPPREKVSLVAYQGGEVFLGRWHQWLKEACALRGWAFVVNPPNLSEVDILVAFRDGVWDGWMCREWKSGVKLVNAIAAGRPMITQPSAAFGELMGDATLCEDPDDLHSALDEAEANRDVFYETGLQRSKALTLEAVAARYGELLARVEAPCPM